MSKHTLFLMLGVPGSGKSYFAEHLARELGALHINSDAMRMAIFGSRKETDRIYHSDDRATLNTYTFGAMNYAAQSALKGGVGVVYDANNNTKQERLDTITAMQGDDLQAVVIWVQTPQGEAVKRAQKRRESDTQRNLSIEDAEVYIAKIASEIEAPGDDEKLITIDGTTSFDQQYESFKKQLRIYQETE